MRLPFTVCLLVCVATPADAWQSSNQDRVRTELQTFMSELSDAIRKKDRAALERLYAPEFQWMHAFGNRDDREEQIASIMDPSVKSSGVPPLTFGPDTNLIVEGNVAVLRRTQNVGGQRLFSTALYVKRKGAWQLLQMQGTVLAPERIAIEVPVATLRSYAGNYQQSNGNRAIFSVTGQELFVQFPNRPRWRLTPVGADLFFDPSNNRYTFSRDAQQRVQGYSIRTHDGAEITGERTDQ